MAQNSLKTWEQLTISDNYLFQLKGDLPRKLPKLSGN